MKSCPHCKRPYAPDVPVGGVIRQRIYDYVAKHPAGVTRKQIMDWVWQDDESGGPESPDIVSVNIWHINKRLEKEGREMRIRSSRGHGALYRIVGLSA